MIISNQQKGQKKQNGIALLTLVIVLALTFTAYYFSSISIVEIQVANIEKTGNALKQAKQALLGHALIRADLSDPSAQPGLYGFLPCPADYNGEGKSVGNCEIGKVSALGWFPWHSLGVTPIKDGNGDCLLYAVSSSYKYSPSAGMLNEDTNGMFQVVDEAGAVLQGAVEHDRVVAIVFSAGNALAGQNRVFQAGSECGNDVGNFSAYLDTFEVAPGDFIDNSDITTGATDIINRFVQAASEVNEGVINDQFITITRDEVWKTIMQRVDVNDRLFEVTEALTQCLANYVNDAENPNRRLPWPALMNSGDYREMANYSDELNAVTGYAGRFPFHLDDSNAAIATVTTINDNYLDDINCSNLNLPISGLVNINFTDEDLVHRRILNNWKDHFFYALSKDYALPDDPHTGCSGDCVSIEDPVGVFTNYAAIVFYSGSPYTGIGQSRNIGDKSNILNYLENGNGALFPDVGGNGVYTTTNPDPLISNDVMFCLTDGPAPTVVRC